MSGIFVRAYLNHYGNRHRSRIGSRKDAKIAKKKKLEF
jgi:hypothetical protein